MAHVALADRGQALSHPQSFITKYIWSQDHKVIAIQYGITAIAVGVVALILSGIMRLQLGFPDTFSFIQPSEYYQFVTMHGMIMVIYLLTALFLGGFGNYLIPLMVGARDMVFPYLNMLSYWVYLLSVIILMSSFFVTGGPTGAGWTLYPPQAIMFGTPGVEWGIILMLVSLFVFIIAFTMGGLNYVTTVLQARTRGMTLMRMPLSVWGIFTATVLGLLAFPALLVSAIMMTLDRVLGTSFFMPAMVSMGEQTDYDGGSPVLFRSSGSLHCGAAGIWHRFRPVEHARKKEYLRLSDDGLGYCRHWWIKLRRLGASHVRERHESLFWFLFRHHDTDHCSANRHNVVAWKYSPEYPDVVRHWIYFHLHTRRLNRYFSG